MSERINYTQEIFSAKCKEIFGDTLDFSLAVCTRGEDKIRVVCPIHGEFEKAAFRFVKKHEGCPKCNREKMFTPQEQFIDKVASIFGDKYDLSQTVYKGVRKNVDVVCKKHGVFHIKAGSLLQGHGCMQCGIEAPKNPHRKASDVFVREADRVHDGKYDYSKVQYRGLSHKIEIICPTHGSFYQYAGDHLKGCGCKKCCGLGSPSTEEFIIEAKKIHGDKYDYTLAEYKSNKAKVAIVCPKHGVFWQRPNNHISGKQGCPLCTKSYGEERVKQVLEDYGIKYIQEKRFDDCRYKKPLPFDFYLPEQNTCIEFQGEQHYVSRGMYSGGGRFEYMQIRDQIKRDYCKNKGIKLVEIKYTSNIEKVLRNNNII